MISLLQRKKKEEEKFELPLYDLSKLPEEYLRNEYPEVYNSLRKKKYDVALYFFP